MKIIYYLTIAIIISLIILICVFLFTLEYKCDHETEKEKYILDNYNSKVSDTIHSLNKKDEIIIRDYILSLIKKNSYKKQKKKIYNNLYNNCLISGSVILLSSLSLPAYSLYPISATIVYIISNY